MNGSYLNNRMKLAGLIFSLNRFTESELSEKYTAGASSSSSIGGLHSIRSYLNDLTQFGTLRYENGVYKVADYGENRYV